MGLDIVAYKNVKLFDNQNIFDYNGEIIEKYENENVFVAYCCYESRSDNIEQGKVYRYSDSMHFRYGTYSNYNVFRECLSILAGFESTEYESMDGKIRFSHSADAWVNKKKLPFYELIDFSYCEGIIGNSTCKKIYKYFFDMNEDAKNFEFDEMPNFYEKYLEFMKAFKFACENGVLVFC